MKAVCPSGCKSLPLQLGCFTRARAETALRSRSATSPERLRARTEVRHCAKLRSLHRCKPVKAHPEEALVERGNGRGRGSLNVLERNGTWARPIPPRFHHSCRKYGYPLVRLRIAATASELYSTPSSLAGLTIASSASAPFNWWSPLGRLPWIRSSRPTPRGECCRADSG